MPFEPFSEADFRVLGLEPGSNSQEVRKAYRALVKKWHPDRHHSEPYEVRAFAEKKFIEIDEAYRRISSNWKERAAPKQRPSRPVSSPTGPRVSRQRPRTSAYKPSPERTPQKIDIRSFLRARTVVPSLLFIVLGIFLISELSSFIPYNNDRTVTPNLRTEKSTQPYSGEPSEEPVPPPPGLPAPPNLLKPEPEQPKFFFTLGSSSSEVLKVQGPPARVNGQTWIYGLSEIQFRNGRVSRFNNFDGSLRVRMQPEFQGNREVPSFFTIGSSEDEVLLVQGTPSRVDAGKWFYGFAEIRFKDGRVSEYDNYFGTLKVRLLPTTSSDGGEAKSYFTIGSTQAEVLSVQGTPTSIQGSRWSFDFSVVSFREGKVFNVINADGNLRYVPPEANNDKEG